MAHAAGFGRKSVLLPGRAPASPDGAFEPAEEKYAVDTLIGEGGMGEISWWRTAT